MEPPFVFVAFISARAQSNPEFRVILRFPYPSETKTSPKSWRRLSLLDLAGGVLMDAINKRRINQMATNDGFQPDRSPLFLSGHAEETEQPDIGKAWNIATISSRILKTSIVAVTVIAIGIAILSIGNPVALVANVTDWWVDKPVLQPDADPSTSTIQSVASTHQSIASPQDLPPTTADAPTRDEIAAAVEPADQRQAEQSQAEVNQPITEALFKQFQAWAAEQETRAQVEPAQPVQAAPVKVAQDAPAQVRPVKKHRRVQSVRNARAEIRSQRNHRARVREEQDARAQAPPVADPRAQDPYVQNAQPPSLLQSLGLRN
ncbi:hypothetical protein KIP88_29475 [Bradyrhizobium sp. SRL28]|uniref:hypothetical protein n=1 Tax=Bradyrhizobium sp. SRL28 TaxID=2836178 RepID=UPI001BDE04FC|nr:hypothetical protein [Bradyrhizobium sp. SRL28]MBT1514628.1 hypothetical protein [Bradyrhizobium sp. SRL28]